MTLLDPRRARSGPHNGPGCHHGVPWAGHCHDCLDNIAAAAPRMTEAQLASTLILGALLLLVAVGGLAYLL